MRRVAKRFLDRVLNFIGFEAEPEEEMDFAEEPETGPQARKQRGAVLSLHTPRQMRVVVAEPRAYEEVQGIAENLKNGRPVIVNLEQADGELARRVVDFLSGATFALNGNMQKVGHGIFLFVPRHVDITNELKEQQHRERGLLSRVRP